MSIAWAINATQRLRAHWDWQPGSDSTPVSSESKSGPEKPILVAQPFFGSVLDDALMTAVMVAPTPVLNCLAVLQEALSAVPPHVQEICVAAGCESLDGCCFSLQLHQHGGGIKPLLRALLFLESLLQRLRVHPSLKCELERALQVHIDAVYPLLQHGFNPVLPAQCFLALLDNGGDEPEPIRFAIWDKTLRQLWTCLRPFWQIMMSPDAVPLSSILPYMFAATASDWSDTTAIHARYSSVAADVCHLLHVWPGLQFVATNGGLGLHPLVATSPFTAARTASVRQSADAMLCCAFGECAYTDTEPEDARHQTFEFKHADNSPAKLKLADSADLFSVLQTFDTRWLHQTSRTSPDVFRSVFPCMSAAMHADCTRDFAARNESTEQLKASLLPGTLPGLEASVQDHMGATVASITDAFSTATSRSSAGSWIVFPYAILNWLVCLEGGDVVYACFDCVCRCIAICIEAHLVY